MNPLDWQRTYPYQGTTSCILRRLSHSLIPMIFFDELIKRTNEYLGIYDYIESIFLSSIYFDNLFGDITMLVDEVGPDSSTVSDSNWFDVDVRDNTRINRYIAWQDNRQSQPLNNFISVVHYVKEANRKYVGSVTLNLRSSYLEKMLGTDEEIGERLFVIDNDSGKVIISDDRHLFLKAAGETDIIKHYNYQNINKASIVDIDDESYIISAIDSDYMNWTYILAVPLINYDNNVNIINVYVRQQLLIYLAISLILSYFLSIKKPINP